MVAARRTRANFGLQHAVDTAAALGRPLVIFEPLRVDYRWASDRLHHFVIDGMAAQARALAARPVVYLPHVERTAGDGARLFDWLATRATAIVTDDSPASFLPRALARAANRLDVRLEAVDSNGLLPIRSAPRVFPTALGFRAHLQRTLRPHLAAWPGDIRWEALPPPVRLDLPPDERLQPTPVDHLQAPSTLLAGLPIDHGVAAVATPGGAEAARRALGEFVEHRLRHYATRRNDPDAAGTSGLSPYVHFGHIGAHEVFQAVMTADRWTTRKLSPRGGGKREGWWGASPAAEAFLDQLVTWRELGLNLCTLGPDYDRYTSLPAWARATLAAHAGDPRPWTYTIDRLTRAATHDPVWNAAQRQLLREGWMDNYLRMLWGKKILEWSPSPEAAFDAMVAIMDRLALDGRDPNSYTGYGWTLGR